MEQDIKKRGQKIIKRFSRFSKKASAEGKEHIRENVVERISHIKNIRLLILEWALLVLAIIMLSVTQAFLYAGSYAVTTFTSGGTYTEATLGRVNSLNPLFATTDSEKTLSRLMFATLSAVDYSGHIGLGLADSIKTDETGSVWTVNLRDGLTWSDGEPLTADDVIYTVKTIQSPLVASAYSSNLSGVSVEKASDSELIFTLPTPYANFSSALEFPILPAHVLQDVAPNLLLENNFSSTPVTSGAFSYNATQSIGSSGEKIVYLNPNRKYYGGSPILDSFAVHAYLTKDNIIAALNSGVVTATAELLPTDADEITSSAIYEKQTALSSGVFAFLNTTSSIFSNKSLRQAVQKGVDMRSLRAPLGDEPSLDYPLLTSQLQMDINFPALPEYDPDAAKQTIKEANVEQPLRLATIDSGYFPALAENLKFQLENLGFSVELNIMPANQDFLVSVIRPRNYDILIYEIELGSDSDLFAYYHSSQISENGLNLSNYSSPIVSDVILATRSTLDESVRQAKFESFLKSWVNDVPAIGIYQVNLSYFVNKNVRSFSEDSRLVTATDRFSDVSYWATEKTTKNRTP